MRIMRIKRTSPQPRTPEVVHWLQTELLEDFPKLKEKPLIVGTAIKEKIFFTVQIQINGHTVESQFNSSRDYGIAYDATFACGHTYRCVCEDLGVNETFKIEEDAEVA